MGGDFADVDLEVGIRGYDVSAPAKLKPGIQLGLVLTIPLNDQMMLQPGVVFAQQGAKWEDSGIQLSNLEAKYSASAKMTLNYFQFPVNFIYRYDMSSSAALLLQAGPYLGYGLGGKEKSEYSIKAYMLSKDESDEVTINFGNNKNKHDFKAADFGMGIGAGLLFAEKFQISLGYNLGLADIGHYVVAKNNGIAFTMTYWLGK